MAHSATSIRQHLLPWAALLTPPLLWAGNFVVGRAMHGTMPPITLSLGRWLIALACLLPFALKALRRDRQRYWEYRWLLLGTSATGVAAFSALVYVGLRSTTASNGLLLNSLIPLLIVLLGALLYRQGLSFAQGLGMGFSFLGVVTLALHGHWTEWRQTHFVPGDGLVFIAMVCFALYTLWLRKLPPAFDRIGLMAVQIVIALVLLLPFWLAEQQSSPPADWNLPSIAALIYLGLFPSVLAYLLYMRAVQYFGAARAGLSIHLIPVFGVILSMLFLHEQFYLWQAEGMAAIALGLVISSIKGTALGAAPARQR